MFVNDPSELALPPKQISVVELEEPRDYHEFFWEEAIERGRYTGRPDRGYTQVCRLDSHGEHVTMARDCPHFDLEDEMGRRINPGWTVQQNGSVT